MELNFDWTRRFIQLSKGDLNLIGNKYSPFMENLLIYCLNPRKIIDDTPQSLYEISLSSKSVTFVVFTQSFTLFQADTLRSEQKHNVLFRVLNRCSHSSLAYG